MNTDTDVKLSLSQRINWRMLIFFGVMALLIGYPLYVFVSEAVSGGVHDRGSYLEVDLKAMSNFEMDQENATLADIPEQWRKLEGKRIQLEGEMWQPTDAGGKVGSFQLCYSIAKCCFSGPPKVQHFVNGTVVKGKRLYAYPNLVRVIGTLHINVKRNAEKIESVYQLDVESVEPVT
jgi:hypothetical protein